MLTRKMIVTIVIGGLLWGVGSAQAVYWGTEDETGDASPFGAASMPAVPAHEPGELIVKFSKPVAETLPQQLADGKAVGNLKLSASLDKLAGKYKLKKIEPIINNFKAKRERMKGLLKKDKASLTKKDKHLLRRLNRAAKGVKVPDLDRIYKVELGVGQSALLAVADYEADTDVEYAELNYYYRLAVTPNDPNYYPEQWPLHNNGQSYPVPGGGSASGTAGSDVNAPEAWDIRTDASEVIVAVLDSGVDHNHADLSANMWTDTDGSHGHDFYWTDDDPMDDFGHGTHCAGIIAADSNNGVDIAGVCWTAKIMSVKIGSPDGFVPTILALVGIDYAVEKGADVLSCSWGGYGVSKALEEAFDYAYSQGVISVASAGNDNTSTPDYPAAFDCVIAVAATDSDDQRAIWPPYHGSNYGDWIDVAAPGDDILSLHAAGTDMYEDGQHYYPHGDPNATMYIASGTSMSCPHVAGLAALCLAEDPNLKVQDLRLLIKLNAHDVGDPTLGAGRIDAYSTVSAIPPNFPDPNQATEPDPCDDANSVSINTYLSWTPDELASSHDVYVGTNFNDVNDADTSSAVFRGNVIVAEFDPTLEPNTTYYWRIDERNYNACTKGAVWSFITRDGSIIYVDVDANDGGDGMSWATAFNRVEDAFDIAVNDEIWVAEGTYILDTTDRDQSFAPPENTKLYGGFAGDESSRSQRDPNLAVNATILSGNINDPNNYGDNCKHVIRSNSNLILDRFTIRDGYCTGRWVSGAGMNNEDVSSVTVTDCTFTENRSLWDGGGVYNLLANKVTFGNCKFFGNTSPSYFGGALCNLHSVLTVSNCTFSKNEALWGGAVFDENAFSTFGNCVFTENKASHGGGVFWHGGGLHSLDNCTFSKNEATETGGGLAVYDVQWPEATNCIFWDNTAGDDGNEVYLYVYDNPPMVVSYCDIKGCGGSGGGWDPNLGTDGGGNIDQDPCFANADANDLHLGLTSPCIDAGDPNFDPYSGETDIDGDVRVIRGRVDMGADEVPIPWYVDIDATGNNDGTTWANAFLDLQDALDAADSDWLEIWVAEGTYKPGDANGFTATGGANIYGGFDATETARSQRDWTEHETILSGNIGNQGSASDDAESVLTLDGGTSSVVDGFTITEGRGGYPSHGGGIDSAASNLTVSHCVLTDNYALGGWGGGMMLWADATVNNCVLVENIAFIGGGLAVWECNATIINCTVTLNMATESGGGLEIDGGTATVTNCILWDDVALGCGNEIFTWNGTATVTYSDVRGGYTGTGNINADPNFVDSSDPDGNDNQFMTSDDGLAIDDTEAIDAANGNVDPPKDMLDNSRYDDPNWPNVGIGDPDYVDMGAYEYDPNC